MEYPVSPTFENGENGNFLMHANMRKQYYEYLSTTFSLVSSVIYTLEDRLFYEDN